MVSRSVVSLNVYGRETRADADTAHVLWMRLGA